MAYTILRLPAVEARTGLPKSTIYAAVAARQFPAPIKIGPRASGWVESEIDSYIAQRIAARDGVAA